RVGGPPRGRPARGRPAALARLHARRRAEDPPLADDPTASRAQSPRVLASIPSPPNGVVHLGGITIHMYGVMLLLAIAASIVLTGYRWKRLGGDWDLVVRVAVWGVAWGVVGARVYHDITSSNEVPDTWWGPIAVWKGGLGVW